MERLRAPTKRRRFSLLKSEIYELELLFGPSLSLGCFKGDVMFHVASDVFHECIQLARSPVVASLVSGMMGTTSEEPLTRSIDRLMHILFWSDIITSYGSECITRVAMKFVLWYCGSSSLG